MERLRRLLAVGSAFAAVVAPPQIAAAWGTEAHTVTARVAYARLSGQAKADFDWIVQNGVPPLNAVTQGCQIDPANPLGPVNPGDDTKTNLANWPDCFRVLNPQTAPLHFDDIPLATTLDSASDTLGLLAANPDWCVQGCVSKALADNLRTLATPNLAPADAARALANVVHFMGDLHQPLHVEDNADRGGNAVTVSLPATLIATGAPATKNLHSTWDGTLVAAALGSDLDTATMKLAKRATKASPSLTDGTSTVEGVITTSDKWVAAGHDLAASAYSKLTPRDPILAPPLAGQSGVLSSKITSSYVKAEDAVVVRQLTATALRLAATLTAALTWTPPP